MRIKTYEEAFYFLGIKYNDKAKLTMTSMEKEGYSQSGICFGLWKGHEKIMGFKGDNRLWSIMQNEIRKHTWKNNDARWNEYNDKKRQDELKQQQKDVRKKKIAEEKEAKRKRKIEREATRPTSGFVYFIQDTGNRYIKIGYTEDIKSRASCIQTGNPNPIDILAYVRANKKDEAKVHVALKKYRHRGEWFKPTEEVLKMVEAAKKRQQRQNLQ